MLFLALNISGLSVANFFALEATPHLPDCHCSQPISLQGAVNRNRLVGDRPLPAECTNSLSKTIGLVRRISSPSGPIMPCKADPDTHGALGHIFASAWVFLLLGKLLQNHSVGVTLPYASA